MNIKDLFPGLDGAAIAELETAFGIKPEQKQPEAAQEPSEEPYSNKEIDRKIFHLIGLLVAILQTKKVFTNADVQFIKQAAKAMLKEDIVQDNFANFRQKIEEA